LKEITTWLRPKFMLESWGMKKFLVILALSLLINGKALADLICTGNSSGEDFQIILEKNIMGTWCEVAGTGTNNPSINKNFCSYSEGSSQISLRTKKKVGLIEQRHMTINRYTGDFKKKIKLSKFYEGGEPTNFGDVTIKGSCEKDKKKKF